MGDIPVLSGCSRWGKGHYSETWLEAFGFNLLEGNLNPINPPLFFLKAKSLAPLNTLLMSNYLPISLYSVWECRVWRKRGNGCFGCFLLNRGVVGSSSPPWGHFWRGRCHSTEWYMIWQLVPTLSRYWLFDVPVDYHLKTYLLYSRRNKNLSRVKVEAKDQ